MGKIWFLSSLLICMYKYRDTESLLILMLSFSSSLPLGHLFASRQKDKFMRGKKIILKVEQNYSSSGWPAEGTVTPLHHFLKSCGISAVLTRSFPSNNSLNTQGLRRCPWGAEQVWEWNWKFLWFANIHPRKNIRWSPLTSFNDRSWRF